MNTLLTGVSERVSGNICVQRRNGVNSLTFASILNYFPKIFLGSNRSKCQGGFKSSPDLPQLILCYRIRILREL